MKIVKQKGATRIESVAATWGPDESEPAQLNLVDRCVQLAGDFKGGSVSIEGSNDGKTWAPLTDVVGSLGRALVFGSPGLRTVAENPLWLRPKRDGAKDVTVILVGRPR